MDQAMDWRERIGLHIRQLAEQRPHHAEFYNRVVFDLIPQVVPEDQRPTFRKSAEWREFIELHEKLAHDTEPGTSGGGDLVQHSQRWPRGLHQLLQREAHRQKTSLNKLVMGYCVAGLEGTQTPCHDDKAVAVMTPSNRPLT